MNVNGPNRELSDDAIQLWEQLTTNFMLQKLLANNSGGANSGAVIDEISLIDISLDAQFDLKSNLRGGAGGRASASASAGNNHNHHSQHGYHHRLSRMNSNEDDERQLQTIQQRESKLVHPVIIKNDPSGILLLQFTISIAFTTFEKDTPMNRQRMEEEIDDVFDSDHDLMPYINLMQGNA
jgi:hypothetical protein